MQKEQKGQLASSIHRQAWTVTEDSSTGTGCGNGFNAFKHRASHDAGNCIDRDFYVGDYFERKSKK